MTGQTQFNLQGTALAAVSIALTKDEKWHPWKVGQSRLAELGIEEWFSFLRSQSNNSQLSCRGFWQAGARTALKHGRELNKLKATHFADEPSLTDEQLLNCVVDCGSVFSINHDSWMFRSFDIATC